MTASDHSHTYDPVPGCGRRARFAMAAAAGLVLAGCAGALETGTLPPTAAKVPEAGGAPAIGSTLTAGLAAALPKSLPPVSLAPVHSARVPASTAETYIRIARGANQCWFGGQGRLKASHVFYAEADSPLKSGATEIVVHERDRTSERPWGLKTYRISLARSDEQTEVAVENLKMPADEAQRMEAEVLRWAHGSMECDAATADAIAKAREAEAAAIAAGKAKGKRQAAAGKK